MSNFRHSTPYSTHCTKLIRLKKNETAGSMIIAIIFAFLLAFGQAVESKAQTTLRADDFNPNPNGAVSGIAVQPDGKFLFAGSFTNISGVPRRCFARFNADDSLDLAFDLNLNENCRGSQAVSQADGKILVGGRFTSIGGQARNNIARLNADGSVDAAFDPNANGAVNLIVIQPDGKILIGGDFTQISGLNKSKIARLNADGSLDTAFNAIANDFIFVITLQPDGKILVGGSFGGINGNTRNNIARLNADGSLDNSFAPNADNFVYSIKVLPDGSLLVGGLFSNIGGRPRKYLAKLSSDGVADAAFNPNIDRGVLAAELLPDDRILIGGYFDMIDGQYRNKIAGLNADGSLDTTFGNVFAGGDDVPVAVGLIAPQADGRIYVGGGFGRIGSQYRNRIARLNPLAPPVVSGRVSGRVTAGGRPVSGAIVLLLDANTTRQARTNPFGYYRFEGVATGQLYALRAMAKGYQFTQQNVTLTDELTGLNISASGF